MPFEIAVRTTFCAAHHLRLPGGGAEPVHGHNWHVALVVARDDGSLDDLECVADFHDVLRRLRDVLDSWDTGDLNADPHFARDANPTAERVAEAVGRRIDLPAGVTVVRVEVSEAEGCTAAWRPGAGASDKP